MPSQMQNLAFEKMIDFRRGEVFNSSACRNGWIRRDAAQSLKDRRPHTKCLAKIDESADGWIHAASFQHVDLDRIATGTMP